jgi:S1-C subfamily serine protease
MHRQKQIAILGFLLVAVVSAVSGQKRVAPRAERLSPGETVEATLVLGTAAEVAEYRVEVTDDVFRLEFDISDAPADLDLELDLGSLEGYRSQTFQYNETLELSRTSEPVLESGTATIRVIYQFDSAPIVDGRPQTEIPFKLTVSAVSVKDDIERLSFGNSVTGTLTPETGMVDVYRLRVPSGGSTLRLDVSNTDGDLDLFLFEDRLYADPFLSTYSAQSVRSTESLVVTDRSVPALSPGTYYVMVLDQVSAEAPVSYELHVSASEEAPTAVRNLPRLDLPSDRFERALLATVEVLTPGGGGSGCIVSEDGYVITNWHVVEGLDGNPSDDITVAISLDHSRPPAELYRAEVLDYAPDRDLALLRITSGRYGEPLPSRYRFPSHELSPRDLTIATPLQFIGYPWIGGTGSRASLTYTRGTVSGFQRAAFGLLVKTDGEINPGNSGGAALDSRHRLVGFPSSVVFEDAGQLAYIVPVSAIPAEWRSRIGQ